MNISTSFEKRGQGRISPPENNSALTPFWGRTNLRFAVDFGGSAAKIPGAQFQMMRGLGHVSMTENPETFLEYLRPALARLRAAG